MKKKINRIVSYGIVAILLTLVIGLGKCSAQETKIDSTIRAVLTQHRIAPFTIKLLIAQARHESGNYANKLTVKHNNLYGMTCPKKRITRAANCKARAEKRNGYAHFNSIEDSVEDILLYLWDKDQTPMYKTTAEYVRFLKKNRYFEAPEAEYLASIRKHMKNLN